MFILLILDLFYVTNIYQTVVKEVDGLIEKLAIARDHTKRTLDEAVNRFGANEKIQSIKEKWNLTFSNQPIIINDDTADRGYPSRFALLFVLFCEK